MKTSLIIPCLNEEKYLGKCLESVLKQNLLPDEVIICDNGSKDKTVAVAKKYLKQLPLKIICETQKGIIPSLEKAWRMSTGDIILRIDADSVLPPNWIKNIVTHFQKDPKLAACGGKWFASDGSVFMKLMMRLVYPLSDIYFFFNGYLILLGPNFAIRRQVLKKLDGYSTNDPDALDDRLICSKLTKNHYCYTRFDDCFNFHSTRRWQNNPQEIIRTILISVVSQKFYRARK